MCGRKQTEELATLEGGSGKRGRLAGSLIGVVVGPVFRVVAVAATALVFVAGIAPAMAQDVASADIQPLTMQSLPVENASASTSGALTSAVLAAYVARQQAQKGFDIFGQPPQQQLTSAMVSAYAASHYRTNAALDAIDSAAAPSVALATTFSAQEEDDAAAASAAPSITPDMLSHYAEHGFLPTEKKIQHANQEKDCLSKAIYHEARGEATNGQWAVANVIINRALSKRFPTTMCGVIYQNADQGRYRCQFSFACDGRPEVIRERQAWAKANQIAAAAYSEFQHGDRPNVVPGSALYYHTTSVSTNWGFKRVATIGQHEFYSPM